MKKTAIVSVTNNLSTDQRVHKICSTLHSLSYEVLLVGRNYPSTTMVDRPYKTKLFNLWVNKGVLFYLTYNIRLFFFLLFNPADLLWSNDLDTLLPNFLVSRLKKKE